MKWEKRTIKNVQRNVNLWYTVAVKIIHSHEKAKRFFLLLWVYPGRKIRLSDPPWKIAGFYCIRWEFDGFCQNPWCRNPIGSYRCREIIGFLYQGFRRILLGSDKILWGMSALSGSYRNTCKIRYKTRLAK